MSAQSYRTGFSAGNGIVLSSMDDGAAVAELAVDERHLNSGGIVHGGVLMTMADTAAGAAAFTRMDRGDRPATTDAHLTFLKTSKTGHLRAEATVLHAGARFISTRIEIHCDDVLVATGSYSFMRIRSG